MDYGFILLGIAFVLAVVLVVMVWRGKKNKPEEQQPVAADAPATPARLFWQEAVAATNTAFENAPAYPDSFFCDHATASMALCDFSIPKQNIPPRLVKGLENLTAASAGTKALARDPVLAGNVLRLANSPLFGLRSPVSSLEQAIGIMGLGNLRTLLCIEVSESAAARAGIPAGLRQSLWSHVGKTSVIARSIAPAFAHLDPGTLYTVGLLHDIGKLILYGPDTKDFFSDIAEEEHAFGVNHAVAGVLACKTFGLPREICQAILLHHAPFCIDAEDLGEDVTTVSYALALSITELLMHDSEDSQVEAHKCIRESYKFLCNEPLLRKIIRSRSGNREAL